MRTLVIAIAFVIAAITAFAGDYSGEIEAAFQKVKTASYPAGTFVKPMAWSVGQWTLLGITNDDNEKSIVRQALVARDGDYWTLEMKSMNEDDLTIMQLEVQGMDKAMQTGSLDDIEFRRIRMKVNDDEPMVIEGFVLNMAKGMYKSSLKSWVQQMGELKSGPAVTVPAGTFSSTTFSHSKVQVLNKEVEGDCWLSPSVPISGLVKAQNSDGSTQVLLDFGLDGAKPSF